MLETLMSGSFGTDRINVSGQRPFINSTCNVNSATFLWMLPDLLDGDSISCLFYFRFSLFAVFVKFNNRSDFFKSIWL